MTNQNPNFTRYQIKPLAIGAVVIVIGILGFYILNAPDQRTDGQKIGNAIDELSHGVDKAARQLEPRTLGDKIDDAAKDTRDKLNGTAPKY